jgi:hypothetical protein
LQIDPRHRYGHNLHLYYDIWFQSSSTEPFFYWLDIGGGREIHHPSCPRSKLNSQLVMYLGMVRRRPGCCLRINEVSFPFFGFASR